MDSWFKVVAVHECEAPTGAVRRAAQAPASLKLPFALLSDQCSITMAWHRLTPELSHVLPLTFKHTLRITHHTAKKCDSITNDLSH